MMSSSDQSQDDFVPFDLGEIQKFDGEVAQKKEGLDINEFKTLFSEVVPESDSEVPGADSFSFLHGDIADGKEEGTFSLLFEKGGKKEDADSVSSVVSDAGNVLDGEKETPGDNTESYDQIEARIREEAYQEGLAQGQSEGLEKGYQEGLVKGEQEGFEAGEKKGYEEGYQKGEEEGKIAGEQKGHDIARDEARQEIQDNLDTLKTALEEVNSLTDYMVDRYEKQFVALVLKIARKVVDVTIDSDEEVVKRTVLEALKTLVNPEEVVLSISPEDYAYIEMVKDEFFEGIASLQSISVQSDSLINRGGCKIETRTGTVTADPEEKFRAIEEALMAFHKNP